MVDGEYRALKAALEWHLDAGADAPLDSVPGGLVRAVAPAAPVLESETSERPVLPAAAQPLGAVEAQTAALACARAAETLGALRAAIASFDGMGLKDTATNLVFGDGRPDAPVMLVGDAPAAEDDRSGKAFTGPNGQLLDRILDSAGLRRDAADPSAAVYLSVLVNWRPPGGRSPSPAEIDISLPFIERHIQLVRPKILLLCGGVTAKALLGSGDSMAKLRGRWHAYAPRLLERGDAAPIPALALFDPAHLIQNPAQKRLVWADMLALLEKRREMGFIQ